MEATIAMTARFASALQLAFDLHRHQVRKGSGVPYVSHLLAVAALVLEDCGSEDEAIAALLHDAVEDHGERITLEEIQHDFGERVAAIVQGCTDTPADFRGGEKPPWEERKNTYIEHIRSGSPLQRVALADKLHNARSILRDHEQVGHQVFERFTATREQTLWYYRALVFAFRDAGVRGWMLEEFDRAVTELEQRASELPAR
jgi:(p)ppGpp synthase/HD superfamily hydrolase